MTGLAPSRRIAVVLVVLAVTSWAVSSCARRPLPSDAARSSAPVVSAASDVLVVTSNRPVVSASGHRSEGPWAPASMVSADPALVAVPARALDVHRPGAPPALDPFVLSVARRGPPPPPAP
jgi:hypothetical protein